ncbi:MAG: YARHG domain-containing protein [Xanthobacteraceae bacterium]
MRLILTVLAAAVAIATMGVTTTPADAQSCQSLWVERNSYYNRNGYCFRTARAISYFGNGGCYITNQGAVPLSRAERNRIAQIVRMERSLGCSD